MNVSSVGGGAGTTGTTNAGGVTRDDFLKLMVAQLRSQDPLNPADGSQFLAQMAQITSLSELTSLNERIDQLIKAESALYSTQATSLIGRDVKVLADRLDVAADADLRMTVSYPQAANGGELTVTDELGNVVRRVSLPAGSAGDHPIDLDLPPGRYRITAQIETVNGTIAAQPFLAGTVSGVDFSTGEPLLQIAGVRVTLPDVLSVTQP